MNTSTKEKGDLLEKVVEQFCSGIENARVTRNARVLGKKTGEQRDVDVLIEGKYHFFDVGIAIEAKNYADPVGVEKVESFKAKLEDIGANLGAMVCPTGFTGPAKNRARFDGIQLFEAYDPQLSNSDLFIPLRLILPEITGYSLKIVHRAAGPCSFPADTSLWRFHLQGKILDQRQMVAYAWNAGMIPQTAGVHVADFGAVTMSEVEKPEAVTYLELAISIRVIEKYFLKLIAASFLRNAASGKDNFGLRVDLYSKEEDMIKNGWRQFESLAEMNAAAEIEKQPEGVRNVIIRPGYTLEFGEEAS